MPNFYKDNPDLIFHLKNLDLDKIIELKEDYFKDKDKFDYAPVDIEDAKDSYERILEVVGDIAGNVIEPNAASVDEEGAQLIDGEVVYAKGTQEALKLIKQAELTGITMPRKYGGLNCPLTIYVMAIEIVSRADAAFMNIFGLQDDISHTILKFGDEEIKDKYLPLLCSGEVTSSMALTEPDAGSDLQSVMLKAYQDENGNWYLKGVKRFITNGNGKISLVLARSEEGTKDARGLSMFLYERDDKMKIRRIEDKLGIHGSPTCELQFNDAPAILVGKRKMGLIKYVMSLMNEARIGVSAQALGIAEAAYREALLYAKDRVQFKTPIIDLLPVSEMLANMNMKIQAGRTLLYETTRVVDMKDVLEDHIEKYPEKKKELKAELKKYIHYADLLTPMVKAYNTEMANQVAYDCIQVHGGTGYMKDFNAERYYRDARITSIYEGTTQLQVVAAIGGVMKGTAVELIEEYEQKYDFSKLGSIYNTLKEMKEKLISAVSFVREKADPEYQHLHSRRLVELTTNVVIGYLMAKDALVNTEKKSILTYFIEYSYPEVNKLHFIITNNFKSLIDKREELLR